MKHRRLFDSARLHRLAKLLRRNSLLLLNDEEAAEYLGISVKSLRKLVDHHVVQYVRGTFLFDPDELQEYLLARAKTPEAKIQVLVREAGWEARRLEKFPLPFRAAFVNFFAGSWESFARLYEEAGYLDAAAAIRRTIHYARERLRIDTIEN